MCRTECERKDSAAKFPKNFALIRLAEKTKKQAAQPLKIVKKKSAEPETKDETLCPHHQRKLEIICIQDRERICSNCALFGSHKNHDIRMEHEVVSEITTRTELLITMYQIIED